MFVVKRHVRRLNSQKPLFCRALRNGILSATSTGPYPSRWRRCFHETDHYAAKRVLKKPEKELIQGPIDGSPLPSSDKGDLKKDSLQDVVRRYMRKFPNCVLLTRVGNFYEVSIIMLIFV